MQKILMYWSNICVLKRLEEAALERLKQTLYGRGIELEVRSFGLGHEYAMNEYMRLDDAVPDIIVSTDAEVFEDAGIFGRIENKLKDISGWFTLKDVLPPEVRQGPKLLPFLVIPLVFSYNDPSVFRGGVPSLRNVIENKIPLCFGGINNSGARSVVKVVMDGYGAAEARAFIARSMITGMPVQAFSAVRSGAASLALVPSIYAVRADNRELFMSWPADGAVAVPSYIAVREDAKNARAVLETLLTEEFCSAFAVRGEIFSAISGTEDTRLMRDNNFHFRYPSAKWLAGGAQEEFYTVYDADVRKIVGLV
ncbi:MAG: ABC transporter substrate-binding protein [Clostridiales bacterium]|jgi:hypothetical protein|nr:ABC transporter substrate-binding protein [Clostridiales bacterium]